MQLQKRVLPPLKRLHLHPHLQRHLVPKNPALQMMMVKRANSLVLAALWLQDSSLHSPAASAWEH